MYIYFLLIGKVGYFPKDYVEIVPEVSDKTTTHNSSLSSSTSSTSLSSSSSEVGIFQKLKALVAPPTKVSKKIYYHYFILIYILLDA